MSPTTPDNALPGAAFRRGFVDALPICLGYFGVGFAIAAAAVAGGIRRFSLRSGLRSFGNRGANFGRFGRDVDRPSFGPRRRNFRVTSPAESARLEPVDRQDLRKQAICWSAR